MDLTPFTLPGGSVLKRSSNNGWTANGTIIRGQRAAARRWERGSIASPWAASCWDCCWRGASLIFKAILPSKWRSAWRRPLPRSSTCMPTPALSGTGPAVRPHEPAFGNARGRLHTFSRKEISRNFSICFLISARRPCAEWRLGPLAPRAAAGLRRGPHVAPDRIVDPRRRFSSAAPEPKTFSPSLTQRKGTILWQNPNRCKRALKRSSPNKALASSWRIDSGGIRGLMTIEILAEIERTLRRLFGQR